MGGVPSFMLERRQTSVQPISRHFFSDGQTSPNPTCNQGMKLAPAKYGVNVFLILINILKRPLLRIVRVDGENNSSVTPIQ